MRQTSPTATEAHKRAEAHGAGAHQRLRDVDRWKDKIEIRLDNRQVAFLFFGSALIACLLFILGVIVGKRLESRGHALAPEIEDPLALLDRVASSVPSSPVARTLGQVAISRAHAAPAARPAVVAAVAPELEEAPKPAAKVKEPVAKLEPKAPTKVEPATLPSPPPPVVVKAKPAPVVPPPAAAAAPVPARPVAAAATAPRPAAANPELLPPTGAGASPAAMLVGMAPVARPGTRFMLQVGSFQDRAEAEAFASSFSGERPQIITSELPGKGTWYRVRVGGWAAFQEAVAAKLAFEKRYSKIALVVGPL
jgi:DedD protein